MVRRVFQLWTVLVAVTVSASVSGRFAEYRQAFDVEVIGSGPAVVLVPGLATSGDVWDSTVEALEDRYQLHVLTLAGFGGPKAIGAPFLPRVVSAIVEYVDELGLEAPVLVGHSLGGYVALAAAGERPDAFGGVVSVDGVPFLPALINRSATPAGQADQAAAVQKLYQSFTQEQFMVQTRSALTTMITSPDDITRAMKWASRADPAAAGLAVAEMMTTDGRTAAARIVAPVLLIGALGGAPDAMRETVRDAYRAQVAGVPNATVVFAERARHFIMVDDPDFFVSTLESFLARTAAARKGAR